MSTQATTIDCREYQCRMKDDCDCFSKSNAYQGKSIKKEKFACGGSTGLTPCVLSSYSLSTHSVISLWPSVQLADRPVAMVKSDGLVDSRHQANSLSAEVLPSLPISPSFRVPWRTVSSLPCFRYRVEDNTPQTGPVSLRLSQTPSHPQTHQQEALHLLYPPSPS